MAITLLQPFNLDTTGNYTFNTVTANIKSDNIMYANGSPYNFSTVAAGSNTQVQFNTNNAFAASAALTFDTSGNVLTVGGNLTTGNANLGNLATANFLSGNGSLLTSITGGNVTGQVANALLAGTVYTNAQPNITSVGTLSTLNVTGNTTANYFIGNGSQLTGVVATTATSANTVTDNAQPNITSLGTLSSLNVTGNVTGNYFVGNGSTLSSITGSNVTGVVANANYAAYAGNAYSVDGSNVNGQVANALLAGTVYTNAQPNITSVGTLSSLNITGNISSAANVTASYFIGNGSQLTGLPESYSNANVAAYLPTYTGNVAANYFIGNGATLTSITGANVTGTVANANYAAFSNVAYNVDGSNVSGQVANALVAGTVYTNAQPNITSLGTLTNLSVSGNANIGVDVNVTGNALVTGNLTVQGNTTYINVETFIVEDPIIELGGGVNGAPLTTNDGKDRGTLLHYYTTSPVDAFMGWDVSNSEFAFGSNVSTSSDVVTFNSLGNVRANYYFGNGSQLTGVTATTATTANTVIDNAQPNITSLGTLSSLNVTSNVTANYFIGNGSTLTNITGANVTGTVANANYATYAGNAFNVDGSNVSGQVSNALIAGTVYTNAQPNITSLGTLSSLNVTSNVTANYFVGNGELLTSITGANVTGFVPNANVANTAYSVSGSNVSGQVSNALVAGTVYTNAQPNITSLGTLSSLNVTGNISTAANVTASYFIGNGSQLTGLPESYSNTNVAAYLPTYTGNVAANYFIGNGSQLTDLNGSNVTGQVANALLASTVYTNAQPNITSLGTLSSLNVTGNVTANYFVGNGELLTSITGGNVTGIVANANYAAFSNVAYNVDAANINGQVANALVAGTVYTNAQPNITSVGTLASLNVTGNISSAANVSASYFIGNGSQLTGVTATTALTANTVTDNAQPNITSVGTLASLNVTGNVTGNYFVGNGSALTSITAANITGTVANANYAAYAGNAFSVDGSNVSGQVSNALVAGTVYTNAQPNITSLGTLSSLNVTANVTANYFVGNGELLTSITGGNVTGQVANALIAGTVYTNAQPNITSIGTLANLTVSGNANVQTDLNVTGNALVTGNLTVQGNTQYINVETLVVEDPIIELGGGPNGDPLTTNDGKDRGTLLHYYTTAPVDAFMGWDNSNGEFSFGSNVSVSNDVVTFNTLGNVRANYYLGNGSLLTGVTATTATTANTVIDNAQPNITSVGTLSSLNVNGNVTANYFIGNGSALTSINGSNVTGTVANANYAAYAGNAFSVSGSNVSGQVSNALIAGTVYVNAQPNITSVGTLSSLTVNGIVTAGGVLVASGTVTGLLLSGTLTTANQPNVTNVGTLTSLNVSGNVSSGGNVTANYFIGDGSQLTGLPATYSNTNVAAYLPTYTGNLLAGNANLGNNVSANYFTGNGSLLTSITGANVTGQVGNALVASTVYTNAQPNITSLGTLSSLNVTANVTANYFVGNGELLTSITGSNVTGQVANALIAGTVYTNAQPNITSLGTLSSLNVTANVTANYFVGNGELLTSITGGNVTGQVANALIAGTVYTNAQPNITSVGTLSSLNVTGNVSSAANVTATYFIGNGSQLTGISAGTTYSNSNVEAYLPTYTGNLLAGNANLGNSVVANYFTGNGSLLTSLTGGNVTGQVGNALIAGTVYTNAQPNITSLGTLSSLNVTANVTANYFVGNGSALSSITGGNVTGQVANALIAGTVYTNAQPNITSVGTLTTLTVSGNLTANGNVISGSGSGGTISGANLVSANYFTGTLTTGAQPNITSTGTLTSLIVSGNASFTGANTYFANISNVKIPGGSANYVIVTDGSGNLSWAAQSGGGGGGASISNGTSNVNIPSSGGNVTVGVGGTSNVVVISTNAITLTTDADITMAGTGSQLTGANLVSATYLTGTLTTAAQPNITSVGTMQSITMAAATSLSGGNLLSANFVTGTLTTAAQPNITSVGTMQSITMAAGTSVSGGNLLSANFVTGTLTTAAQPNITSVGTLTSISVTGNTTSGNFITAGAVLASTLSSNIATGTAPISVSSTTLVPNLYVARANVSDYDTVTTITTGTYYPTLANGSANGNYQMYSNTALSFNAATGALSATLFTGTLTTGAQPNITSVGTMQSITMAAGTSISGGNLLSANFVTGTLTTAAQPNITSVGSLASLTVTGLITATGTGIRVSNIQDSAGTVALSVSAGNLTVHNNIVAGGSGAGNVTASYFVGNGSALTSLTGGSVTGQVANALVAGTVYTAAQPNITSVGTLASLNVTGNISSAANVTASYFVGNGSALTGITATATSITNGTSNVRIATSGANVQIGVAGTDNVAVFSTTALTVSGNITTGSGSGGAISGANSITSNYITASTNLTVSGTTNLGAVGNITITGGSNGQVLTTNGAGGLSFTTVSGGGGASISNGTSNVNIPSSGGNVTISVGGTTNVAVFSTTGMTLDANDNVTFSGSQSQLTGANLVSANFITGTLTTAAQPNITSVGTLAGITATGTINFTGASNVSLGPVGNVKITGGTNGYVLSTDGAGTLSWVAQSGGGGGGASIANGTSNINIPTSGGNILVSVGGTANLVTFTTTGLNGFIANTALIATNLGASLTGAVTVNVALGSYFYGTATGTITWTFSNPTASGNVSGFTLELANGGIGAMVWPASVRWPSAVAPILTNPGVDILTFWTDDGGTNWRAVPTVLNSA